MTRDPRPEASSHTSAAKAKGASTAVSTERLCRAPTPRPTLFFTSPYAPNEAESESAIHGRRP